MKRIFYALAFAANTFLVTLWLTGFLAAYINPTSFWVGGVLAVGLPFLTLGLVPFAIVHLLTRKWMLFALHLVMVLLVLDRHWSIDRLSRPDALKGDWTLMTFNTPRYPDTHEAREHTNALVRGIGPTMIGLQEFSIWASRRDPSRVRAHMKFLDVVDSLGYAALPPRDGPVDVAWVAWVQPLLSVEPIESQDQHAFIRDVTGWPTLYVLRTVMKFDDRRFAHYNVHLFTHGPSKPWNGDGGWLQPQRWLQFLSEVRTAFRVRAWQAEQIRRVMEEESLPVILSGDFNGTADNWSYRVLSDGLQDAFRSAGDGWGATYHSKFPLLRIDFVLLGPEFEPVRARVPHEYDPESDHLPLVVRFRWREADG